jgi:voltage-gated sodium channel
VALQAKRLKQHVTETAWFSGIVLLAIFCATVSTAIASYETSLMQSESGLRALQVLEVVDDVVLWSFMVELVLKLVAEAPWVWPFFRDNWNIFDFVVVVLSFPGVIPVSATSVVRGARLLRVLKLVRVLPGLRRLVRSLANSLSSLVYIAGLIMLLLYLWAVAGAILLGRNDPAHWKGVHTAALTLYTRGLLGDDWGEVLDTAIYGCASDRSVYTGGIGGTSTDGFPAVCAEVVLSPFSGTLLTLSWQVLGTFVCLNLLVGSIVQSVSDVDEAEASKAGSAAVVQVLRGSALEAADLLGTSDPYVVVTSTYADGSAPLSGPRFKTKIKFRTLNPRWVNEEFIFQPLEEVGSHIVFKVYDYDRIGTDDFLGEAVVDMHLLPEHHPLELEIPLTGVSTGTLTVKLERRLDTETVSYDQLSPEDRLNALCKKAEALWDKIRWELSAAAASRKRLRKRALANQAQALKRLSAMGSALVQAKHKVTRMAAGHDTARSTGEAMTGRMVGSGASGGDMDAEQSAASHIGSSGQSGGGGGGGVVVDRALDGWVRATADVQQDADGPERVRWFKMADAQADAPHSDAVRISALGTSGRRLIGDTGWFADLAALDEPDTGMELGDA